MVVLARATEAVVAGVYSLHLQAMTVWNTLFFLCVLLHVHIIGQRHRSDTCLLIDCLLLLIVSGTTAVVSAVFYHTRCCSVRSSVPGTGVVR